MSPARWLRLLMLCGLLCRSGGASEIPNDSVFQDTVYYITTGASAGKILNIDTDVTEMLDGRTREYKKINSLLVHKIKYRNGKTVLLHPRLDSLEREVEAARRKLQAPFAVSEKSQSPERISLGLIISPVHIVGLRIHVRCWSILGVEGAYGEDDNVDFKFLGNMTYPGDFSMRRAGSLDVRARWGEENIRPSVFAGCVWLKTEQYSLLENSGERRQEDSRPDFLEIGLGFEYRLESRFAPALQTAYFFKLGAGAGEAGFVPSLLLSYYF